MQVNKKTRTSAYQLLVDIAHELDDARPLTVSGAGADSDDEMGDGGDAQGGELEGGLIDFVNAVMAGLVGASPHMQVRWVLGWGLGFEPLPQCSNLFACGAGCEVCSVGSCLGCVLGSTSDLLPTAMCGPACLPCYAYAVCCRAGPVAAGV